MILEHVYGDTLFSTKDRLFTLKTWCDFREKQNIKITKRLNVNYVMIMPSCQQRTYILEHILRKLLAHGSSSYFSNCTFQLSRPFSWQTKSVTPVTINHPQRPLKTWIRVFFQHQVNNRWWSDKLSGSLSTIHSCYYWQGWGSLQFCFWEMGSWCLGQDALAGWCHCLARWMSMHSPAKFCALLTWFSISHSLQMGMDRKVRLFKYPEALLGYLMDTIKSL